MDSLNGKEKVKTLESKESYLVSLMAKKLCVAYEKTVGKHMGRRNLADKLGLKYQALTSKMNGFNRFNSKEKIEIEKLYNKEC